MSDKNGTTTTTTTWQDNHSGLRRHQLMTRELADTIPPLYANDGADDPSRPCTPMTAQTTPTPWSPG